MAGGAEGLGREIVLGLLIERPGSGYQLEKRLRGRFHSSDYADGTARQTLGRLQQLGLARPAAVATRLPRSREATVWEATPAGEAAFRAWVRESISTPPVREELHAKIALCQPRDLPRLIEVVREAERVCVYQLQAMNRRLSARRQGLADGDWAASMDLVVAAGEKAWWDSRIKWLQGVRVYLSQELARPSAGFRRTQ
ncbi:MAG: PadR family transcriptional regulator [Solirubrobacteraceae bacterium]